MFTLLSFREYFGLNLSEPIIGILPQKCMWQNQWLMLAPVIGFELTTYSLSRTFNEG
jgi:hypothetical protein